MGISLHVVRVSQPMRALDFILAAVVVVLVVLFIVWQSVTSPRRPVIMTVPRPPVYER